MSERIAFDEGEHLWAIMWWNPSGWWVIQNYRYGDILCGKAVFTTRKEARETLRNLFCSTEHKEKLRVKKIHLNIGMEWDR